MNLEDESQWGEPQRLPRKKSDRRQRTAVVSVRLNGDELSRIVESARLSGQTVGTFMRSRSLAAPTPGIRVWFNQPPNGVA